MREQLVNEIEASVEFTCVLNTRFFNSQKEDDVA